MANGLLEPTAWGCRFLPRRSSTSITSISNPPASCRQCLCLLPQKRSLSRRNIRFGWSWHLNRSTGPCFTTTVTTWCPSVLGDIDGTEKSMRQKHWRTRRLRSRAEVLRVCSLMLVLTPGGPNDKMGHRWGNLQECALQLWARGFWSFGVSLFARISAELLKSGVWYLLKRRPDTLSCVTSRQFLNVFVNMGLCSSENESKEKRVSSFRCTPLSWFTAFVVGRLFGRLRGFE